MVAAAETDIPGHFALAVVPPLVNHQIIVHPQADTIIHNRMEAIGAPIKVERSRPAHREIIAANVRGRRTAAPIKVDIGIVTREHRRTGQITIREIVTAPLGNAGDGCAGGRGR